MFLFRPRQANASSAALLIEKSNLENKIQTANSRIEDYERAMSGLQEMIDHNNAELRLSRSI